MKWSSLAKCCRSIRPCAKPSGRSPSTGTRPVNGCGGTAGPAGRRTSPSGSYSNGSSSRPSCGWSANARGSAPTAERGDGYFRPPECNPRPGRFARAVNLQLARSRQRFRAVIQAGIAFQRCRKMDRLGEATRAAKWPLGFFVAKALFNRLFRFVNAGLHVVYQFFLPFSHKLMVCSFTGAVACKGQQ